MDIGTRIKEIRVEKKWSQKTLASKIYIAQNTLSQIETNIAKPSIDVLVSLADILEVSIDYLLGREDDFGNVTVYQQTDNVASLSSDEQRIIDYIRKNPPHNATEWMAFYAELPRYMQESIFAELKGMHLGYTVSKATKNAGESKKKA